MNSVPNETQQKRFELGNYDECFRKLTSASLNANKIVYLSQHNFSPPTAAVESTWEAESRRRHKIFSRRAISLFNIS